MPEVQLSELPRQTGPGSSSAGHAQHNEINALLNAMQDTERAVFNVTEELDAVHVAIGEERQNRLALNAACEALEKKRDERSKELEALSAKVAEMAGKTMVSKAVAQRTEMQQIDSSSSGNARLDNENEDLSCNVSK